LSVSEVLFEDMSLFLEAGRRRANAMGACGQTVTQDLRFKDPQTSFELDFFFP
jgi:hypothetical protein